MKEFNLKSFHVFYADDASALEKAALLNEIRTLKQAGRHLNIFNVIGAWVNGGKVSQVEVTVNCFKHAATYTLGDKDRGAHMNNT